MSGLTRTRNNGVGTWAHVGIAIVIALGISARASAQTELDGELAALGGAGGNVNFNQAANEDSPYALGDVHWINSILQQNNSQYTEGMSVPQRIILKSVETTEGNVHTLTFSHQATKSTSHAYDFLTSWGQAFSAAVTINPTESLLVSLNECGDEIAVSQGYLDVCLSVHSSSGHVAEVEIPDSLLGDPVLGGNVDAKAAAYEVIFGNRTLQIRGNQPITSADLATVGHDGASDESVGYVLTWVSESTEIVIEVAGHLAVGIDPLKGGIGYGVGLGSASISGGPYHFFLDELDGASLGNKDNQIKGADIRLPSLGCGATSNNGPLCEGDTLQLETEAAENATYEWTGPDGFTSDQQNPTIPNVTTNNAGTYTVVTSANGESQPCDTVVVVYPPPECSISGVDGPLCPSSAGIVYSAPAGMTSYLWGVVGNASISGAVDETSVTVDAGGDCDATFTLELTIEGSNGCVSICSREISVSDTIDPTASDPAPLTVECRGNVPVPDITVVTNEADNCTDDPVVAFVGQVSDGLSCPETITRTYSVTDDCGNSINVTQRIIVVDTIDPTASDPAPLTVECRDDVPDPDITVVTNEADNCTDDPVVAFVGEVSDGLSCPETITRTYSVADDCGNSISVTQTIIVVDTMDPTFTAPADITIYRDENCEYDAGVGVTGDVTDEDDNCGVGEATYEDSTDNSDPCSVEITRTWSLMDDCGNSISATQTITVVDAILPTFTAPSDITIRRGADGLYDTSTGVTGDVTDEDDNCGVGEATYEDSTDDSNPCSVVITRTWSLVDDCGNPAADQVQTITVTDDAPPVVTCPPDRTISTTEDVPAGATNLLEFLDAGGQAWDNNGLEDLAFSYEDSEPVGDACESTITRTYTVVDVCENRVTCEQLIHVEDSDPIIICPEDYVFSCEECPDDTSPEVFGWAEAFDDDGAALEVTYTDITNGLCPKVVVRTWATVDACSNEVTCVQTIACLPPALVTSSALCTFDVDGVRTGRQFRLIYTHDGQHKVCQKLTASNPGQFFFNAIYRGTPGEQISMYMLLPYPFVTQGATPIHAYDWVGVDVGQDAAICLQPGNAFWDSRDQVTLETYGEADTVMVSAENLVVPDTGMIYLNIHLDYGLKKQGALGRDEDNNAIQCWDSDTNGVLDVIVSNHAEYVFGYMLTNPPPVLVEDTVESFNDFKHVPGVSGLVLGTEEEPVPGLEIQLLDSKGRTIAYGITDETGAYVLTYKRIGKNGQHYVKLDVPEDESKIVPVTLGPDGYLQVNFRIE